MDPRQLPPSRNVEDRRPEEGYVDPLAYMPWAPTPRQAIEEPMQYIGGPQSRALGIEDIGTHPRPPSLYDMMGQGRDLPLPPIQGNPPWRMIRGR
jgi:hypothetical protein